MEFFWIARIELWEEGDLDVGGVSLAARLQWLSALMEFRPCIIFTYQATAILHVNSSLEKVYWS